MNESTGMVKYLYFTEDPFYPETKVAIAKVPKEGKNEVITHNIDSVVNPSAKFLVSIILSTIDDVTYDSVPSHFGPHFTLK